MTEDRTAASTCPRCGAETTEAELTYSGCAICQAEAAENARQDAADEARSAAQDRELRGLVAIPKIAVQS